MISFYKRRIDMKQMVKVAAGAGSLILIMAFLFVGCSTKVDGITDPDDKTLPSVVQVIPPDGTTEVDPGTIIVLFFDDVLISSTVTTSSVQVTRFETGDPIPGQLFLGQSQAGNTIVTFVPTGTLPVEELIDVDLPSAGGVQDDGGNELASAFSMSFQTAGSSAAAFDSDNWGFEDGTTGFSISGDGARLIEQEDIIPPQGSWMAAISSGEDYWGEGVVSTTEALDYTTSVLTTGDITVPGETTTLKFDYDFVSAEFNEWVGSEFDDTFVVAIRGSSGVYSEVVTSVNVVGVVGTVPVTLPTSFSDADYTLAPGDGEDGAGRTGWTTKSINISSLGNPISIAFIVSDVGDWDWTTIVFIDNIRFE
jgi:hypothetical protein